MTWKQRKEKLLILQTHPIQYFAPLYRSLAERAEIDSVVVYLSDAGAEAHFDPGFERQIRWDVDLLAGYRHVTLEPGSEVASRKPWQLNSPKLSDVMKAERPQWVMVYGYSTAASWAAVRYARRLGAKVLYLADSNANIEVGPLRRAIKYLPVRYFFARVDRFLFTGEANKRYLALYGVGDSRMTWCPFAIDVERFSPSAGDARRPFDFVWAGKLVERKRVFDYISALKRLQNLGIGFRALLVGDGPQGGLVRAAVADLLESGALELRGFANQSEMPAVLRSAETLVFSSSDEPYGLVVTEAAAAGCALIVAEGAGCVGAQGPAQPRTNAVIYPVGDIERLTEAMRAMIEFPDKRESMQEGSLKIAANHDVSRGASIIAGIVAATGK